jgi:hypothetical protein
MKAITTKYLPKSGKTAAYDSDGNRALVSPSFNTSEGDDHRAAATALCKRMNWHGTLQPGELEPGKWAWVWIRVADENFQGGRRYVGTTLYV